MGCPAPKVVKNGDGSKLLLNLDLVGEIVSEVVKNSSKPVTVKIRKGWDDKNVVAVEAAKIIEEAGASAIVVHGRTREEFYSGIADWNIIKKVKWKWRYKIRNKCFRNVQNYWSRWNYDRKRSTWQSLDI